MKVRNVRPYPVQIATTSQTVGPGGLTEVEDDVGRSLLEQPDAWRPADDHVCEVCGFEASNARGLASHQRTHDEEND